MKVQGSWSVARLGIAIGLAALFYASFVAAAAAATGPLYDVKATWGDQSLPPGGAGAFMVQVRNVGDATGSEDLTITEKLPTGVTATRVAWRGELPYGETLASFCTGVGTGTVTCVLPAGAVTDLLQAPGSEPSIDFGMISPTGYTGVIDIQVAIAPGVGSEGTNVVTVSGGGAPPAQDVDAVPFGSAGAGFGIVPGSFEADVFDAAFPFGAPSRTAGDHPFEQRVSFDLNGRHRVNSRGEDEITSEEFVKDVDVTLPRGFIGNPEATPKCDPVDFAERGGVSVTTGCPSDTQVGYIDIPTVNNIGAVGSGSLSRVPLYNLIPPKGVPADFGFNAVVVQGHIYPELDPSQGYAIKAVSPDISSTDIVRGAQVTIWGVPGDPAHDKFRVYPKVVEVGGKKAIAGAPWGSAPIRPLLTNPMDCGFDNGGARIQVRSYTHPNNFTPAQEWPHPLNVSGCDDPRIRFEPEVGIQPTDRAAGAPTGLNVHLEVPQRNDEVQEAGELYARNGFVKGISTPPLKRAVVTFPEGMTLSPAAADGLGSCTPQEIGLGTNAAVTCPDRSQYGTLILHTPILPANNPPKGFIYIAKQGDNPFHNFLSIYLVIEEPERGILVKLPGRIDLDPGTGRITVTFDDLPQFPVSDMEMTFKGGVRAGLVEPSTCGTKTITAEFFSWADPHTPQIVKGRYDISQKPNGSPCVASLAERPFEPKLEAGTTNPIGGSYSPFVFRLTRSDDDQEFSRIDVELPEGLSAKFAQVGICPDAAIAQAEHRSGAGDGAIEQGSPSCPADSQVGTTQVGTGVGASLAYVPGRVYMAGPYEGAPMSLVVISPAIVGPFDLGVIAVRTALRIDPVTARGSAQSDPLPQIFQGIPVRIRDIRLNLDRPGFTLNPTSCAPKRIEAHVTGTGGDSKSAADDTGVDLRRRFQVADCSALAFKPRLSLRLFGGVKRGAHPKLRAVLAARAGDANIAGASVALPHWEFLDQAHIKTICTRVQFAQDACPAGSVYGFAVAKTPLFDQPLRGPVYLRSSNHTLPDLVAALRGPASQPVEIDLAGRIDSTHGRIRTTFEVVPDAPVTQFRLSMKGGRKGLLVNSTNLCAHRSHARVRFSAQNGKVWKIRPVLRNACSKKRARPGKH